MLQFPGLCCDPGPERNGEAVLRGPADPALGFQPRVPVFPVLSPVMRGEPLSWGCHGDENATDLVPSREPARAKLPPPPTGGEGPRGMQGGARTPLAPGKHRDPKAQPWVLGRPAFLRP